MTVSAGLAALALAACIGYYLGWRAASTPLTWRKRTSRIALGKSAVSLLTLLTARHIRKRFLADHKFNHALRFWGPRLIAPVELLRGSLARMRS
jgi:hypothetical protein